MRWVFCRTRSRRSGDGTLVVDSVVSDVTHRYAGTPGRRGHVNLTRRQRQILLLLDEGASTDTIASRLGLQPTTVKNHVAALRRALGARSRLEAVAKARRQGLL